VAVRLALIGCGIIAETHHAPQLRTLPSFEIVAAVDVDASRRAAFASRFGIEHQFDDLQTALAQIEIDAVAILTPPNSHTALALTAMQAGKHVLIEKPLALTMHDCDTLIAARDASGVRAMVGFHLRWHRHTLSLRQQMHIAGSPALIQSTFTNAPAIDLPEWRREFGGDLLSDQAIHHIDLWRMLTGNEIRTITAQNRDEHTVISAETDNGIVLSAAFSRAVFPESTLRVYTASHRLSADFYRFDGFTITSADHAYGGMGAMIKGAVRTALQIPRGVRAARNGGDFALAYRAEWEHFAACITHNRPPSASLEDGREAMRTVLAAHRALEQHHLTNEPNQRLPEVT